LTLEQEVNNDRSEADDDDDPCKPERDASLQRSLLLSMPADHGVVLPTDRETGTIHATGAAPGLPIKTVAAVAVPGYDRPVLSAIQQERLARNEAFFREVNEHIDGKADNLTAVKGNDDWEWEYFCECADPACVERVTMRRSEYEALRANPARFILCPGHAISAIEHVVAADPGRIVVEKDGRAATIALELDPRSA
jgi:hypothetical protein